MEPKKREGKGRPAGLGRATRVCHEPMFPPPTLQVTIMCRLVKPQQLAMPVDGQWPSLFPCKPSTALPPPLTLTLR